MSIPEPLYLASCPKTNLSLKQSLEVHAGVVGFPVKPGAFIDQQVIRLRFLGSGGFEELLISADDAGKLATWLAEFDTSPKDDPE